MRRCLILGLLIAGFTFQNDGFCAELVHIQTNEHPVENRKKLKMDLREVDRQSDVSTIHVTFESGGSVSSSMLILKGLCAIAESRKTKFFRQISESTDGYSSWVYKVAFSNDRNALKRGNTGEDISSLEDCHLLDGS